MKSFITIAVTAMLMVPELLAGNGGLALGLPLYGAVCFAVAFGQVYGIAAAVSAAFLTDIIYDRPYPLWTVWAAVILFAAAGTARRVQRKQPFAALLSGGVCGIMTVLFNLVQKIFFHGDIPGPEPFSLIIFHLSGGIFFMFVLAAVFDALNLRSDLPRFGIYDSRSRLRETQ